MEILNRIIKNHTPYVGKIKLKVSTKIPNYNEYIFNKIHFSFGTLKLFSIIKPDKDEDGWILKSETKPLIEKYTSCLIGDSWEKDEKFLKGYRKTYFLYRKNSGYICDLDTGWWIFKNGYKMHEEYPQFIALKYTDKEFQSCLLFKDDIKIYLNLGDKIFEETYKPSKSFHDKKNWKIWVRKFKKDLERSDPKKRASLKKEGLKKYLPLQQRGRRSIKNEEDCVECAKKIGIYLSDRKNKI